MCHKKTTNIKKEVTGLMGVFQRKEITNHYNFTFTNTSKIMSKGLKLNQSIIHNVYIGPHTQQTSQSEENYDKKRDIGSEKIKVLKSISSKLNLVTSNNTPNNTNNNTNKDENKSSTFDNVKDTLLGSSVGVAATLAAKKYGGTILKKSGSVLKIASVLGKGVASRIIPGVFTLIAAKNLYDRVTGGYKDYKKYTSKGDTTAAKNVLFSTVFGGIGDALGMVGGLVPGPIGWLLQGLGGVTGWLADEAGENSEKLAKEEENKKNLLISNPNKSLQNDINAFRQRQSISDITQSKPILNYKNGKNYISNYKDNNGSSLNHVSTIKGKSTTNQVEVVNKMLKNNEANTINALNGNRKKLILPNFDIDGNFVMSKEELNPSKILLEEPQIHKGIKGSYDRSTLAGGITKDTHRITSDFGMRNNPFGSGTEWHPGIDIAMDNSELFAPVPGKITIAENHNGYGKTVVEETDEGPDLLFGHLSDIKVKRGQKVNVGDLLGVSGNTGRSTGGHLHFGVYNKGMGTSFSKDHSQQLDPVDWINNHTQDLPEVQTSTPKTITNPMRKLDDMVNEGLDAEVGRRVGAEIAAKQNEKYKKAKE
jgi:murein DD-endopeptidase MepM/ murein hydrolase activator NlpD